MDNSLAYQSQWEGISNDRSLVWPIANLIFTCASSFNSSYSRNFLADPILYIHVCLLILKKAFIVFFFGEWCLNPSSSS